jgi:hypothetical protein
VNKEALEELSFGLDLLNLATHLSDDVSGDDADKVQNAVHVLRIVARGPKSEQPPCSAGRTPE